MDTSHSLSAVESLNSSTMTSDPRHPVDNSKDDAVIRNTFDLLKSGEEKIKLTEEYKNLILVLGDTGNGKSKFTEWITGNDDKLISKETKKGTGEYIIVHSDDTSHSTITSHTIYPELIVDSTTNTPYYDCPGFKDTRSTSNDIATTYFVKGIVDYAETIKMIFIINYPSVRTGVHRHNFIELLRQAIDFVKNIDKFRNSIALVATKVDNQYIKQGGNFILVDTCKIIDAIGDFLQEVKDDLKTRSNINEAEALFCKNAVKFIEVLLAQDNEQYTRIGIFRRPDEPGALSEIALLKEEKNHILRMIHEKLSFTEKNSEDFGYTISGKSKNHISELVEEINKSVWNSTSRISEEIHNYYRHLVAEIRSKIKSFVTTTESIDIDLSKAREFSYRLKKGYDVISNLKEDIKCSTTSYELFKKISNIISNFDIQISNENVLNIESKGNYFNFLQVVSNKKLSTRPWNELLSGVMNYLVESRRNILEDIQDAEKKIKSRILSCITDLATEMKAHYTRKMKQLEIQVLSQKLNKQYCVLQKMTEKLRSITTTIELVSTISENSNILGIKISDKYVVDIENQGNYFEYLRLFCERELDIGSMAWVYPIQELTHYIYESEKWYIFLDALYNKFSEYEVQRDKNKYNVENLEDWGIDEKPQGIQIIADTFHQFLSKIDVFNIKEYESIKDITATELRLEELNHALCLTLKHKINIIYKEPCILIKGDYIRMEEFSPNRKAEMDLNDIQKNLLTLLQSGRYKFLNVFAMKTLFIDSDATFPGIGMRFIAPKWEIKGTRNINLNGICGEPHWDERPKTVQHGGDSGKDGKAGKPGRPGGSFFCIGEHFVKGYNLTVTVNGGDGSSAQHGEHGKEGLKGNQAYLPADAYYTYHADLRNGITSINGFRCQKVGEIKQLNCIPLTTTHGIKNIT
ncbi:uncharacterized protein CDAR_303411 [Caerostris darwini]|uniref:G domain-containing protein n=1 Tax=Caerostris darwini TaxID=1538125 RepID=A0AAV4MYX5_9ARAC|nr:uncharacterized protein CDAR_303411 [Caerostris darwini]